MLILPRWSWFEEATLFAFVVGAIVFVLAGRAWNVRRPWAAAACIGLGIAALSPAIGEVHRRLMWSSGAPAWVVASGELGRSSAVVACAATACLFVYWLAFERRHAERWLVTATHAAAWAYALQKLNCFFEGCCHGRRALSWGVRHAPDSRAASVYGELHCVVPIQALESIGAILLAIAIARLASRENWRWAAVVSIAGAMFLRAAALPFRHETIHHERLFGASVEQAVCLGIGLFALAYGALCGRRGAQGDSFAPSGSPVVVGGSAPPR